MTLMNVLFQPSTLLNLFVIIVSFIVIYKSAGHIILAMEKYGRSLGLSDSFLGMFVVGTAVAIPIILTSINGIILKDAEMMLGSVLGANLLTIGLILGISGFKYNSVSMSSKFFSKSLLPTWGLIILPLLLLLDGKLNQLDGVVLLFLFFMYLRHTWKIEKSIGHLKKKVLFKNVWKSELTFLFAFAALLLSTRWLVFSASVLSKTFQISSFLTAITVVALGTTFPHFVIRFKAKEEGHSDLAMGTQIGRLLITFVFFLGLVGIFSPISIQPSKLLFASLFMLISTTIFFFALKKKEMGKIIGFTLLVIYFAFIILEILKNAGMI